MAKVSLYLVPAPESAAKADNSGVAAVGRQDGIASVADRVWSINGDFTIYSKDGVQRYSTEVTRALDGLIKDKHPLTERLILNLIVPEPHDRLRLERIAVTVVPEFRSPRLPQVWCQFQLPGHVRGGLISFCNLAPVSIKKQIVCIHDLQTRLQPDSYSRGFRWAHRVILPIVGRRCFAVTTVSDQSAQDLRRFGIAGDGKVSVTWNGADHARRWRPEKAKLGYFRPYVFGYVRPQAHKNAELFWKIAPALDALGVEIVLSGKMTDEDLRVFGPVPSNVRLAGRLDDDSVAAALKSAVAFLLPSRAEGFGLPMVEAMIWSCPVVASDIATLRSVGGDAARYANPDVPEDWIGAVRELMDHRDLAESLRTRGTIRAEEFSWRRIAERYLELMARADGFAPP